MGQPPNPLTGVQLGRYSLTQCRPLLHARSGPLLLARFQRGDSERLARGEDRELLKFIKHGANLVDRANQQHPELQLGYCFEEKVEEITRRLRSPAEKVRMLLIWSTSVHEKAELTMARMASRSQQEGIAICLICDAIASLPEEERQRIENTDVKLLEKNEMDYAALDTLLEEAIREDLPSETEEDMADGEPSESEEDDVGEDEGWSPLRK